MSNEQNLYQCPECGLHYKDKEIAKKCEAWCKNYKSCNLVISQQSVEAQQNRKS